MFRIVRGRIVAGCAMLFLLLFLCSDSPAAVHEIAKDEGRTIAIPALSDGDTLAIVGDVSLVGDDWTVLRTVGDAMFHLILNAATTSIPDYAMNANPFLLSVSGSGVESVGGDAFNYCSGMAVVALPRTRSIGQRAFYMCTKLTEAIFPKVTTIDHLAFAMCAGLTRISFPAAQTTGSHSFAYCYGLTEISFPVLKEIGSECFSNCTSLSGVSFPKVTEIGSSAFETCSALEGASFPSAESVGYRAFGDCASLSSLSIPSVKEIGDYAFVGVEELSFLELSVTPPTLGVELFDDPGGIFSLVPDGAAANYAGWPGGILSEGNISHGGTLLMPPGETLALSATFAAGATDMQWQRSLTGGEWTNAGGAGSTYTVASLQEADEGQYSLTFRFGGAAYRTAPLRLVVGTNPALVPEAETLTVPVGRPLDVAFYAEGVPVPGLSLSWLDLPPDDTVLSATRATITGVPGEVGISHLWAYAENSFSFYSGFPASRVYALDVVNRPVTGVELNKERTAVRIGGAETLYASVLPLDAANQAVSWSSDNPSVALVYPGGRISRASLGGSVLALAEGNALITVTTDDGGRTDTCLVTVLSSGVSVTGILLDRTELELAVGETARLRATVVPEAATNQRVAWSSASPTVATVAPDGYVTAVSTGSTTVTVAAEDGGASASCLVRVVAGYVPVRAVLLNKSSTGLLVGGQETLYATVLPNNATNKAVTWVSEDPSAVSVSSGRTLRRSTGGTVTGLREGRAIVTATAVDGGASAGCVVMVSNAPIPVTGLSLDRTLLDLDVDESVRLVATISPPNATDQAVVWSSEDAGIASVDQDGSATGVAAGTTTISAAVAQGGFADDCRTTVWDLPEIVLHPLSGEFRENGFFSLRFRVETLDGGIFPVGLVDEVKASLRPEGHAVQCGWSLDRADGVDQLTVTGHFVDGGPHDTFLRRVIFDFGGGRQRTVDFSPELAISDFASRRGSGGCDFSGFALCVPSLILLLGVFTRKSFGR